MVGSSSFVSFVADSVSFFQFPASLRMPGGRGLQSNTAKHFIIKSVWKVRWGRASITLTYVALAKKMNNYRRAMIIWNFKFYLHGVAYWLRRMPHNGNVHSLSLVADLCCMQNISLSPFHFLSTLSIVSIIKKSTKMP